MPITIGEYSYDVVTGVSLTSPQLVAKPRKEYLFDGDTSIYIQNEDYQVFIDYYEPLKPSTRHPDTANLFYIKDTPISDIGNGVGAFTRTYGVLPGMGEDGRRKAYVRSEYESYVMSVPGISNTTTQAVFQQYPVSSYSVSSGKHTITTSAAHDITVGRAAIVYYQVKDPLNKFNYLRQAYRIALAGTAGSALVVEEIKDINTIVPIGVQRANNDQSSYQKVVNSRIDYTYHLPGVDVNTSDDIEIIEPFFISENQTGNRVDYLSDTTTPSLSEYLTKISEKAWMPVECVLKRWQGEMIERSVRYVRYGL